MANLTTRSSFYSCHDKLINFMPLFKVHFMIEPFCVILKRTLSSQHPLNQILKYHCREILVPNTFGVPGLLDESKLTDLLFAYGNEGAYQLLRESYPLSTWEITDYRANIEVRGQHVALNRNFRYKRGLAWEFSP